MMRAKEEDMIGQALKLFKAKHSILITNIIV